MEAPDPRPVMRKAGPHNAEIYTIFIQMWHFHYFVNLKSNDQSGFWPTLGGNRRPNNNINQWPPLKMYTPTSTLLKNSR